MSDILTVTISGPPLVVERLLRPDGPDGGQPGQDKAEQYRRVLWFCEWGGLAGPVCPVCRQHREDGHAAGCGMQEALRGEARIGEPARATEPPVIAKPRLVISAPEREPEPPPAENHTETIPEPDQNHTEPAPARPPAEKPARRKATTKPAGPSEADLELLAALTEVLRPAVDIAVQLGIKRTSCGGVARKLDRLADEGRCERGELPDGKRGYRALSKAGEPLPEPTEESDQTPTLSAGLPARAPYLHVRDLMGHARSIADALLLSPKPLARNVLAEQCCLADEEVRDTLRLLIRQGYVTRLDGNVVRYALTDDVVRGGDQ